jgi:hypothetical protein
LIIKGIVLVVGLNLAWAFRSEISWARGYLIVFWLFCLDWIYVPILLHGFYKDELVSLIMLIVFISGFFFLGNDQIKISFPNSKKHKYICSGLQFFVGWKTPIAVIFYVGFWYKIDYQNERLPKFPVFEERVIKPEINQYYSKGVNSILPFPFSIKVPSGTDLLSPAGNKEEFIALTLILRSCQKSSLVVILFNGFNYKNLRESVGHKGDDYSYFKRIVVERFGVLNKVARLTLRPDFSSYTPTRIWEMKVDGLSIFVFEGIKLDKKEILTVFRRLYVFREGKEISRIEILGDRIEDVDSIVYSLKPLKKSLKSPKEYFVAGKRLFDNKNYRAAQFQFAAALYFDWDNPHYLFYLGRTYIKQNRWSSALTKFERVKLIKADYPDILDLIKEAEEKKDSEKNLCYDRETDSYRPFD